MQNPMDGELLRQVDKHIFGVSYIALPVNEVVASSWFIQHQEIPRTMLNTFAKKLTIVPIDTLQR